MCAAVRAEGQVQPYPLLTPTGGWTAEQAAVATLPLPFAFFPLSGPATIASASHLALCAVSAPCDNHLNPQGSVGYNNYTLVSKVLLQWHALPMFPFIWSL